MDDEDGEARSSRPRTDPRSHRPVRTWRGWTRGIETDGRHRPAMSGVREALAGDLTSARDRTLRLTDLDEPELLVQHTPLLSPLVWDLAHIGQQEDLWLLRGGDPAGARAAAADGRGALRRVRAPPAVRVAPAAAAPVEARAYGREVRGRVLDRLERLGRRRRRRRRSTYAHGGQHEQQHDETMLATHQLRTGRAAARPRLPAPARPAGRAATSVLVPAGPFVLGVDAATSRGRSTTSGPAHNVDLPAFRIGRVPVTNAEYAAFVDDGGYRRPALVVRPRLGAPRRRGAATGRCSGSPTASRTRFGVVEPLPPDEPVQHVSFFEAEAYAAWAGRPAADRGRVGEGRAPGTRRPGGAAATRGATAEPTPALANLGGDALRPAAGGRLPGRRLALRRRADARRRLGVDVVVVRAVARVRPMLYADYTRAVLRRRLPGAAGRVVGGRRASVRGRRFRNWDLPDPAADLQRAAPGLARRQVTRVSAPRLARAAAHARLARARARSTSLLRPVATRRAGSATGTINADGWGVGLLVPGRAEPAGGARPRPAVERPVVRLGGAPVLRSGCVLAAVRSATVGMPIEESAAAPFTDGRWLLSHNGRVDRVGRCRPRAEDAESTRRLARCWPPTCSPPGPRRALGEPSSREVAAARPRARGSTCCSPTATAVVATTWGDSLSVPRRADDGMLVASEPWDDDPAGSTSPTATCVEATRTASVVTALERCMPTSLTDVHLDPGDARRPAARPTCARA